MQGRSLVLALLLASWGCSDAPGDEPSTGDVGIAGGGVGGGTGGGFAGGGFAGGGVGGGGVAGAGGGVGGGGGVVGGGGGVAGGSADMGGAGGLPMGGVGGLPMGGVGGEPMGGGGGMMADRPEELVATVVFAQTGDQSTGQVFVVEPPDLNAQQGCVIEDVNPDAPAPAVDGYDAGEIVVEGLNGGSITFQPESDGRGFTTYRADRGLANPPFAPGATLTANAAGGAHFPAFSISVEAPDSVNISEPRELDERDVERDLDVRWNAAGAGSLLITVAPVDVDSESPESGAWIFCAVNDNGNFNVPGNLLNQAFDPEFIIGQFVAVAITRTTFTVQDVDGDTAVISGSTSAFVPINLK